MHTSHGGSGGAAKSKNVCFLRTTRKEFRCECFGTNTDWVRHTREDLENNENCFTTCAFPADALVSIDLRPDVRCTFKVCIALVRKLALLHICCQVRENQLRSTCKEACAVSINSLWEKYK